MDAIPETLEAYIGALAKIARDKKASRRRGKSGLLIFSVASLSVPELG
jgi:hypothetical protein